MQDALTCISFKASTVLRSRVSECLDQSTDMDGSFSEACFRDLWVALHPEELLSIDDDRDVRVLSLAKLANSSEMVIKSWWP